MGDVRKILAERSGVHGNFEDNAEISQGIKQVLEDSPKWGELSFPQREALQMIALKISRILSGDGNHLDSWRDIAGYAQIIAYQLEDVEPDAEEIFASDQDKAIFQNEVRRVLKNAG